MVTAFWVVFSLFLLLLGTSTRPWRTVKDVPRAQWTGDVAASILLTGLGVLSLLLGFSAPAWLARAFVYTWLAALGCVAAAWLWLRWSEIHGPQLVEHHAPRPFSAVGVALVWLLALPFGAGVVLTLSLFLWNRYVSTSTELVSPPDFVGTLAPPLMVATVLTAPIVWLTQAVRRRRWEDRQRAHLHRETGLEVPPVPDRWVTLRRVLGF